MKTNINQLFVTICAVTFAIVSPSFAADSKDQHKTPAKKHHISAQAAKHTPTRKLVPGERVLPDGMIVMRPTEFRLPPPVNNVVRQQVTTPVKPANARVVSNQTVVAPKPSSLSLTMTLSPAQIKRMLLSIPFSQFYRLESLEEVIARKTRFGFGPRYGEDFHSRHWRSATGLALCDASPNKAGIVAANGRYGDLWIEQSGEVRVNADTGGAVRNRKAARCEKIVHHFRSRKTGKRQTTITYLRKTTQERNAPVADVATNKPETWAPYQKFHVLRYIGPTFQSLKLAEKKAILEIGSQNRSSGSHPG